MNFDAAFRSRLADLFAWRRDVRRFRPEPLQADVLDRLLALADLAPSVGLSQPWRWVIVEDRGRRADVRAEFSRCNAEALAGYAGEQARRYAGLKLAGLDEAPVHLALFVDPDPAQGSGLGRLTMPETAAFSAVTALHTLWLAARAEGIGLGWVSILDPGRIAAILEVPTSWRLIGYCCLGLPLEEDARPALERAGWERRRPTVPLRR